MHQESWLGLSSVWSPRVEDEFSLGIPCPLQAEPMRLQTVPKITSKKWAPRNSRNSWRKFWKPFGVRLPGTILPSVGQLVKGVIGTDFNAMSSLNQPRFHSKNQERYPVTVDASEIRRSPPFGCIKPVVDNGITYQPQLMTAGFLPVNSIISKKYVHFKKKKEIVQTQVSGFKPFRQV